MVDAADVTLTVEAPTSPDARRLIRRLDSDLLARYPRTSVHGLNENDLADWQGVFLVARLEGKAVACGAVKTLEPGTGELKRMFVEPEARRLGIGRRVLEALEDAAAGLGLTVLRLETGTLQPEAIRLYESVDYVRIPCFAEYADDPFSVCYEKQLVRDQGGDSRRAKAVKL